MNQKKHMKFFFLGYIMLTFLLVGVAAVETPTFALPQFVIDYKIRKSEEYAKEMQKNIVADDFELLANMINVNTATANDFDMLPGVGPVTAENIVEYREKIGMFVSINQLIEVERIGEVTLAKIRPYLTMGGKDENVDIFPPE